MKINLSKYPPGTKFKLKNGATVTLIGKSNAIEDRYIVEYDDDGNIVTRSGDGKHRGSSDYDIESVIQPDKYLVSFCRKDNTLDTEIITEPQALTAEHLLTNLQNRYALGALGDSIPVKVLSWSKIEE